MKKILIVMLFGVLLMGCPVTHKKDGEEQGATGQGAPGYGGTEQQSVTEQGYASPDVEEGKIGEFGGKEGMFEDLYFDYDKYDVKSEYRSVLDDLANWLRENTGASVVIEGHCDERGTNEYNLALGDRRAKAAEDYLAAAGVSPARVRTISYGEERPACSESTEDCWSKNRRAHFLTRE